MLGGPRGTDLLLLSIFALSIPQVSIDLAILPLVYFKGKRLPIVLLPSISFVTLKYGLLGRWYKYATSIIVIAMDDMEVELD